MLIFIIFPLKILIFSWKKFRSPSNLESNASGKSFQDTAIQGRDRGPPGGGQGPTPLPVAEKLLKNVMAPFLIYGVFTDRSWAPSVGKKHKGNHCVFRAFYPLGEGAHAHSLSLWVGVGCRNFHRWERGFVPGENNFTTCFLLLLVIHAY